MLQVGLNAQPNFLRRTLHVSHSSSAPPTPRRQTAAIWQTAIHSIRNAIYVRKNFQWFTYSLEIVCYWLTFEAVYSRTIAQWYLVGGAVVYHESHCDIQSWARTDCTPLLQPSTCPLHLALQHSG